MKISSLVDFLFYVRSFCYWRHFGLLMRIRYKGKYEAGAQVELSLMGESENLLSCDFCQTRKNWSTPITRTASGFCGLLLKLPVTYHDQTLQQVTM